MLTPHLIEWSFYRLEQNLRDNNEVREFYEPKYQGALKVLKEDPDDLALTLSEYADSDIDEYFEKVEFLDDKNFIEKFIERNGIIPYPLGLRMKRKAWKKTKMALDIEEWAAAVYFPSSYFKKEINTDINPFLRDLGLILLGKYSRKPEYSTWEHECIHSCCDKHSVNFPLMKSAGMRKEYEYHHFLYIIELQILNEMCAYQDDFLSRIWYVKKTLKNRYLDKALKPIRKLFGYEDISLPDRLKASIQKSIEKDFISIRDIMYHLPRHIVTPLMFGMGPTEEEIKNFAFISPLDSILRWSKMIQDPKLLEKTKSILKSKGYKVD